MQLDARSLDTTGLRSALAAATGALLGAPAQVQALEASSEWDIDSSAMYYAEQDRVSLFEAVVQARYALGGGRSVSGQAVFDTLTGASPNGAIPVDQAQTFTRPSGDGTYTVPAGEQPLDDTFRDTRVALRLGYEHDPWPDIRMSYGVSASNEYDYRSLGAEVGVAWDLWQHTSTLSLGLSGYRDVIEPVGGVPLGLAALPAHPARKATTGSDEDKTIFDLTLGWTQVLTPRSLLRSNLVFGHEEGYLTDPYKLLSVVDPATGELLADPDMRYRSERRPDSRTRWAWQTDYQRLVRNDDVWRISYRYYLDDWGVDSHTLDTSYRWQASERHFLEPRLRLYRQSQADFYRTMLRADRIPDEASADYRLADMTAVTVGLTWGFDLTRTQQLRLTGEYYRQESDPAGVVGMQRQRDLTDELDVVMVRLGYRVQW